MFSRIVELSFVVELDELLVLPLEEELELELDDFEDELGPYFSYIAFRYA